MKKINPKVYLPLKNALSLIYWYKDDLMNFLLGIVSAEKNFLVRDLDKSKSKFEIASDFVNQMASREDLFHDEILGAISAVCSISSYDHFDKLDDAQRLKANAMKAVENLKGEAKTNIQSIFENELFFLEKQKESKIKKDNADFSNRLVELKKEYIALSSMIDNQKKGYEFEKFITLLFRLFDIDSKGSFRTNGEQIDGAFTVDSVEYLLEVKWQKKMVTKSDIYTFKGKVDNKLKTTLGFFISVNGFANQTYTTHDIPSIILCDSSDLISVLENRISLPEIIKRKKQEASRTGNILYRVVV